VAARSRTGGRPSSRSRRGWPLVEGHGYEVTGLDVSSAYTRIMRAAARLDRAEEIRERVRALVARESGRERFVTEILGGALGLR
jgi:hypothetical protein